LGCCKSTPEIERSKNTARQKKRGTANEKHEDSRVDIDYENASTKYQK
jgi:hypothetical protein